MSVWSLVLFVRRGPFSAQGQLRWTANPVPWAALVLVGLAGLVLIEVLRLFLRQPARRDCDAVC